MTTTAPSILRQSLYLYPEVDAILDLTAGTAKRWINGYERAGKRYPPVVRERRLSTDRATWGEFVEVYYLSRFRRTGIPLQTLRRTLLDVRDRLETHYLFSHESVLYADPHTLDVIGEIQQKHGAPLLVVQRTGQIRFELDPEARFRLERITFEGGIAAAVRPRLDMDNVIVAADRFFGKPKIIDTGISPHAVARLVKNGTPIQTVSELYDLPPEIIDEAGRFTYGKRWASAA
ncbi:MAG: hypothetical protein PVG83_01185 [Acidimicrobiia bacterium]